MDVVVGVEPTFLERMWDSISVASMKTGVFAGHSIIAVKHPF